MTVRTLTLKTSYPGSAIPIPGTWHLFLTTQDGYAIDPDLAGILAGTQDFAAPAGVAELTLKDSADLDPPTLHYRLRFVSRDGSVDLTTPPFQVDATTTDLTDIMVPSDLPLTPSLVTQASEARDEAVAAASAAGAHRVAVEAVVATSAGVMATVDADAGSAFRVQQDARLSATFAGRKGANLPRTLAKLRNGENITIGVIGDSKQYPAAPGNAGGTSTSILADLIESRFGVTVTVTNVAESGDTAASQFIGGGVGTLVTAAPDLTVVELGTNDSNADANGRYAAGYVKEASYAAIERAAALIRDAKEAAEFLFIGTTPYTPASSSNPKIVEYNAGVEALAAVVGAEYVDLYDAWWNDPTFQASPTTYLYDSTHPNTAGNTFSANTLLEHFPTEPVGIEPALAPRAVKGKYGIEGVATTKWVQGYKIVSTAGTDDDATLTLTGTWSLDGNYDVTTTVGDSVTLSGPKVRELLAHIDLGSASVAPDYPVVDFYLDDVLQDADVNLHTQSGKDSAAYWLAPFTGLDGGPHSMKIILKAGKLRIGSYAMLLGSGPGAFTPEVRFVDFGAGPSAQSLADGATKYVYNTTLNLPGGWGSADVQFVGRVTMRTTAATTTTRSATAILRVAGTVLTTDYASIPPVTEATYIPPVPVVAKASITGNVQVRLEAKAVSTDKTNFSTATGGGLVATLVRTS